MFDLWETELTEEETEALLEKAAQEVQRRKLNVPVILALEMHKPLANIGGHMAIAMAPFVAPIAGPERYRDYTRLLSNRENVERLIQKLERDEKGQMEATMEDPC